MTQIKRYFLLSFWLVPFVLLSQKPVDYLEIGNRYLNSNEYDSAILNYTIGIEKCTSCHDTLKGLLYAQIGKSHSLAYGKEEALSNMLLALDFFEKTNSVRGKGKIYIYLAEYYRGLILFPKAKAYLLKFENLNKAEALPLALQAYYYNRKAAVIHESENDTAAVINYSNKVIEISKKIKNRKLEASSYNELGYLYIKNNQRDKGIEYYNKSLNIFEELQALQLYTGTLINIIHTYDQEQYEAYKLAVKGLKLIENLNLYREKREFHMVIHVYFLSIGNYKEALFHYKKHQEFNFVIHAQEFNEKLIKIDKEYDIDIHKTETLREQERADFAEKEVLLKNVEKRQLIWYLLALVTLIIIVLYLLIRVRISNKKLENNLGQKEVLFRELHHRVKNNLTLLKSLLYLRSKASNSNEVKEVLDECNSRIHSMALVHQNLYDVDDASKVNLNKYVEELFTDLKNSMAPEKFLFESRVNGPSVELDMSKAIFIGLIVNELTTNSMKYANPSQNNLTLGVTLAVSFGQLKIIYLDNGIGLPANVSLVKNGGFGFKLIQIMMAQVDSEMNYSKTNEGVVFSFRMKI